MDIPQQYLWPLIGVLLGWLLSVLSGGWKARLERKKLIGRLLTRMIEVSDDLRTLRVSSEHFKDLAGEVVSYEGMRQRVYSLHFLNATAKALELPGLVSDLAAFLPLEATALSKILNDLLKSKDLKLDASAKANSDAYIKLLSMHEVVIDACDKEMTRLVSSLALKHGVHTRIKLALRRRRIARSMPGNRSMMAKMGAEVASTLPGGT